MRISWRKSAIYSLQNLDHWRKELELQPIAAYLRNCITAYFQRQDFSVYIPGSAVFIEGYPVDLRMVLISLGSTGPYKVFYRYSRSHVEVSPQTEIASKMNSVFWNQ